MLQLKSVLACTRAPNAAQGRRSALADSNSLHAIPSPPLIGGQAQPSRAPAHSRSRARQVRAPSASSADGARLHGDDKQPPFGSSEWRRRPAAISLPTSARDPGVWFVLAGFVKVAALTMSMGTSPFGGFSDLLVVLPVAIGLSLLAKWIVQNDLMQRKWFARGLVVATLIFLYLSSLAYQSTLRKRYERASAASGEPQTARVAAARPVQHPGSRRLPTAADAEAMGVQWDKPTRRHRQGRGEGPDGE